MWDIHENNIDRLNRHIWLAGETNAIEPGDEPGVEYQMSTRLIKNLHILSSENNKPILIHMKTCGGYVEEGLAIYDAVKCCPCHVRILSYTHARSMSSYILQAANHRVLMPHSYFLFHRGTFAIVDRLLPVQTAVEWGKKVDDSLMQIYVDKMKEEGKFKKWGKQRIINMMVGRMNSETDVYLTPEEAVSWGLADEVFDGDWDSILP
jgi:ATP-dependent protease ClpP protease subunit